MSHDPLLPGSPANAEMLVTSKRSDMSPQNAGAFTGHWIPTVGCVVWVSRGPPLLLHLCAAYLAQNKCSLAEHAEATTLGKAKIILEEDHLA